MWYCKGSAAVNCDGEPSSTEGKLMKKLFCYDYDKTERPVKNHTSSVNVTMSMHIQNYDLYESRLQLNLYVWMTFEWKDELLHWERTEYDMEKLIVDSSELWRPTIVPFSNLDNDDPATACTSHKCELRRSGAVSCVPPCNYKALCQSNTHEWPFDILNCTLHMGMWVNNVDKIFFTENSQVIDDVTVPDGDWKFLGATVKRVSIPENATYPSLMYTFLLERHTAIYGVVLTPGFVLLAINLVVLWMNNGNNERLYILCATCMGHFTYLEYLYWRVPYHGDQVPKMMIFFRDSLIISVLILAFTIILRHTRTGVDQTERAIDRLAVKVASTSLGRVLLQANQDATKAASSETGGVEDNTGASSADGDTVNLVVDGPESEPRSGSTIVANATLVATFMDRLMFLCCVLCYTIMLCNLLPKQTA
ncbi:neuronal acetylcholine receptor subunit alpha-5-like [Anopheles ziemanni]|uniref:neuronal acetylcholine receptor subunit alpha-5-like n=1 Tax=Anopheles coustani TaxID=139045 RepID=UPI00265885C5|nr:neuronal acetylcholine receptor subunit alpha-5-like [Anopheles coustani]XP_058177602.1 neuronal acetylcholine receptor subunit alpha-5-like [Anopheles ziemanni]